MGFDCSGLVQYSFARVGHKLPRQTSKLYRQGRNVRKGELKPGDLVFFNISGRGISHVGIYSGSDRMVHAPSTGGRVREDKISAKYWLKRFSGARRLN
jgi:cell wall-associated NlpC family hydrolase